MASTFTSVLKLTKPGLGDAGWGTSINGGTTDLVEQAVAGQISVNVTAAGPFILTTANGAVADARNMFIVATGTPGGAREIQVPSTAGLGGKLFFVKNSSNGTVTVKVSGQTGVAVPAGASMALKMNDGGTDVAEAVTYAGSLALGAALPATSGGTGWASYAVGDLLYADTATSLAKLAGVATGNVLRSGGVGTAPAWGKVGLTTDVTGTLPVANGGTGQTTASAAFNALAPTTTKGDLIASTGSSNVRVGVGANGQVLVADSGAAAGVSWADGAVTGEIKMWPTGTAPTGYLLCDGTEVSRSTYAALFAVIGTTFGSAGPTTFTLPNYTNRMPIGAGGLYAMGATGGSKDAIVVSHNHTFSATTGTESANHTHSGTTGIESVDHTHSGTTAFSGIHTHNVIGSDYAGGSKGLREATARAVMASDNSTNTAYLAHMPATGTKILQDAGDHTHTITTGGVSANHTHGFSTSGVSANHTHNVSGTSASTGSSGTDANLPPYMAIRFIIKT